MRTLTPACSAAMSPSGGCHVDHVCVCECVCARANVCVSVNLCMYTYAHTHTCTCTDVHIHRYMHMCTSNTDTHTQTDRQTDTHTHFHHLYRSSLVITCNAGYAVRGSSPAECRRDTNLTCLLSGQHPGVGATAYAPGNAENFSVELLPTTTPGLDDAALCVSAPCEAPTPPPHATIADIPPGAVHGRQVVVVTCNNTVYCVYLDRSIE